MKNTTSCDASVVQQLLSFGNCGLEHQLAMKPLDFFFYIHISCKKNIDNLLDN